jgi:PAS domain S-box-containing protein
MDDEYIAQNQTTKEKNDANVGIAELYALESLYKQAEEKLRFQESLLCSVTDASPLAFYVVDDRTDEILYFNRRFSEIWGITHLEDAMRRGEFKNNDIISLCLPLVRNIEAFVQSCKPLKSEGNRRVIEDEIPLVDGRTIRRVSSEIHDMHDLYFGRLYIFEDFTDRKHLDDELIKRTERIIKYQAALLGLAKMDNLDLDSTLERVTEVDSRTLSVERVSVWFFNEDHSEIICEDLYKLSENIHEKGLRLEAKRYPRYFHSLEESRTMAANDACTNFRTNEFTEGYLEPYGITSMMDVPIRVYGRVVGIVCHEHTGSKRDWTFEEQDFAASIADMVSLAIVSSERRRADEAFQKSEERYRALYDANPSMYFTVDSEGRILSVNIFGAEQLGYSTQELIGQSVLMVFHPDDRQAVLEQLKLCLKNPGRVSKWEFRKIRKDGSVMWVKEAARSILWEDDSTVVLICCEDITDRKQAEEVIKKAKYDLELKVEERTAELRISNERLIAEITDHMKTEEDLNKRNRDLEIINAVSQALHKSLDPKEVYRIALDKVVELKNVDLACIYLVDEGKNEAVMQDHRNFPDDFIRRAGRIPHPKGATWKVINSGKLINVKNAREDPDIGPAGRELGFRSMLGIPINLEGKTIGVIWLLSYKEYIFDKSEEELLISIGNQIATAISQARLYETEYKHTKRIEAIQLVSRSVTSKLDYRSVLQEVVENTNHLMGSRFSIIALPEGDYFIPKAVAGEDEGLRDVIQISPDPENMWGNGRGGECIRTKAPIVADDLRNDPPKIWRTELIKRGILSVAVVPLIIKESVKGLLLTYSAESYAFDKDKINLLTSFANQAAIAIENSRLYEETKRQADKLSALYEDLNERNKDLGILNAITQAVHQSLDLEEIYNVALDKVTSMENVDMAMIYLVDEDRKEAILQAHRNVPEAYLLRAGKIPYPKGVTWKVINTSMMLNVENIQKDPDVGAAGRDLGHHSVLGIPIFLGEMVIGVIWFLSYKERKFNVREVNLLSAIGDQIAIAIAKAKLYKELTKKSHYETIINTVTQSVHQSINLQEVLENAVESISQNIDVVGNVGIYLVEGEEAVLKSHRGLTDRYIERAGRIPYPKGFTWKTIIDGRPRYCADVDQDTVIGTAGKEEGIKSYLSMPIQYENKTVGIIGINSFQKNAFDEGDLKMLGIVAKQIEIAINNAKHNEALRESEERYRSLVETAPEIIFSVSPEGKITSLNPASESITGWSHREVIDQPFMPIVHPDDLPIVIEKYQQVMNGMILPPFELRVLSKSGEYLVIEAVGTPQIKDGEVVGVLGIARDVTDRKRAEEALRENLAQLSKKNRYETIISTVTRSVHQSIDLQEVLENAVDAMSINIEGAEHVSIYLVEGEEAVLKAYRSHPDWFVERVKKIPYPKGFSWKVIIDGKPRYCPDVDNDTFIGPAGREVGTKSYLSMPINFEGETVGCINIHSFKSDAFEEEDLGLLEIVAQQIEIAINNAKRAESLRQSEERYRTLFDQSPVGVYIFDRDFKITHCNERFVQILKSSYDKIIGLDIRKLKDQCVLPLMERIFEGESAVYEGFYEATNSEAKLWVSIRLSPLRDANGKVTGGMAVVEDITDRKGAEEALRESLAHLSKKNRYETIISSVTRSVHQSINLEEVLENAVEAMSKNIDGADNVSIYLVEGKEAVIKSYRGYSESFIKKVRRIPYPKGFTWKTIIEGKPLYCPDVDQDDVIGPAGREIGTKSYASMPIRFEADIVGCININSLRKNSFDEEELKLLKIVAQQIEIAINNAKQAEALSNAKEELEQRVRKRTQELSDMNEELRKEIAERKRVEEEIRQTQSFLDSLVENIPDMIFVKNAKDLKFVRFNRAGEELLGYSRENLIGKTDYDFFPKEEADFFTLKDREVLEGGKLQDIPEEPIHTNNKGIRILHTKKIPICNADGDTLYLLGISEDITERKLSERQVKASLEEKEVLLKEIHHRVKNNLQVVSSLLDLQSQYVNGKKTLEMFHETQDRVRVIARIHEQLYQSKDLARIDFTEYIRKLGDYLFQSYGVNPNFIKLKINVEDIVLDVNTAIPCGLIINELVSNSLKHAFRKGKKGEIRIGFRLDINHKDDNDHNLYTLTVSDSGVGFPSDLNFRNTKSLGLQLVNALTNQIGGTIRLNRRHGTTFKIKFYH